jgi:integrase
MKSKRGLLTHYPNIWENGDSYRILVRIKSGPQRYAREETCRGNLNDARKRQLEMQAELERHVEAKKSGKIVVEDGTLASWAKYWIDDMKVKGRRNSTIETYQADLDTFVLPILGKSKLANLDMTDLDGWVAKLPTNRPQTTLKGAWGTLRALLNFACQRIGKLSPSIGYRFEARGLEPKEKVSLTTDELVALLEKASGLKEPWRTLVWIIGTTGMRVGEATGLHWQDLDFSRNVLTIRRSNSRGLNETTKTKQIRQVPMVPKVVELLQAMEVKPEGLIFTNRDGGLVHRSLVRVRVKRAATWAGITKAITTHGLRRALNDLVRQSAGMVVAKSMLGHATTAMHEHYSSVGMGEKVAALAPLMGKVADFGGGLEKKSATAVVAEAVPAA